MKADQLTSFMLGMSMAAWLIASAAAASESPNGPGVVIDGFGVTPEKVATLQTILQATERNAPRHNGAALQAAATPIESNRLPVFTCYLEGTPDDVIARMEAERDLRNQLDFNLHGTSWVTSPGTPKRLTVSFVPDGTFIPGTSGRPGGNNELFTRMDAMFGSVGGRTAWTTAITRAFDRWSVLTGTSYTFVTDDGAAFPSSPGSTTRGDIRISMRNIDGPGNVGASNFFPLNGDMIIDSSENWASDPGTSFLKLRNIVGHEHGHGLGLDHVCPGGPGDRTKLMEPVVSSTLFDGPQQDDIRAVHALYGDALELNGGLIVATPLGTISTLGQVLPSPSTLPATVSGLATPNARRTSIDRATESDFFLFKLNTGWITSITVTPIGTTYLSGPQNSDCSGGTAVPALSQANLEFEIMRTGGSSLLRIRSRGAGVAESFTGSLASGTWVIRILSSGTVLGPQLYNLSVSGTEPIRLEATQGTLKNGVELSWTDAPDIHQYHVLRGTSSNVNEASEVRRVGASHMVDRHVDRGRTYYYWLAAVVTGSPKPQILAGPVTGFAQDGNLASGGTQAGSASVPARVSLAVHPNPGRNQDVRFDVPRRAEVELCVFDVNGRRVALLASGTHEPGTYRLAWDGRSADHLPALAGIYFYHLRVGGELVTARAIRLN